MGRYDCRPNGRPSFTAVSLLAGGYYFDAIHRALERMSPRFTVTWDTLNAADFGVPQLRKRIFFVGTKRVLAMLFKFPRPSHAGHYVTVGEAIMDLPPGTVEA